MKKRIIKVKARVTKGRVNCMVELIALLVFVFIIILIVGLIVFINKASKKQKRALEAEKNAHKLKVEGIIEDEGINTDAFWTDDNYLNERTALSINEAESAVIIANFPSIADLKSERSVPEVDRISFEDIKEVTISVNSTIIKSTSKERQLKLIAKEEEIQSVALNIVTSGQSNNVARIPFYTSKFMGIQENTPAYEKVTEQVNDWFEKFVVILEKGNHKS